jgi:hypothetical protein
MTSRYPPSYHKKARSNVIPWVHYSSRLLLSPSSEGIRRLQTVHHPRIPSLASTTAPLLPVHLRSYVNDLTLLANHDCQRQIITILRDEGPAYGLRWLAYDGQLSRNSRSSSPNMPYTRIPLVFVLPTWILVLRSPGKHHLPCPLLAPTIVEFLNEVTDKVIGNYERSPCVLNLI